MRQLTTLAHLMTKAVIPQQLREVLGNFDVAFLPIAQSQSCAFELIEIGAVVKSQ